MFAFGSVDEIALLATQVSHLTLLELHILTLLRPFKKCAFSMLIHWKLDLADTDLAENLGIKDTL